MTLNKLKNSAFNFLESIIGDKILRKYYRKYKAAIFFKHKIIFIHITKTGGTSTSFALFGKSPGHSTALEFREIIGNQPFKDFFSFSVVRNPYDRAVSSYHYAKQGGGKEGSIKQIPAYKSPMFDTFESFVKQWLIHQDPKTIEPHFTPQHLFVCDEKGALMVKWIGKIENTEEIEQKVLEATGRSISISQKNKSDHKPYVNYYNEEIRQLVYDYYREDFEKFNYSPAL